ncbi:MAG: hypothetical protein M3Z46_03165 [Actinomycetota bacterium]|nr:hypothetical protein [Actinomycetota bacterium]
MHRSPVASPERSKRRALLGSMVGLVLLAGCGTQRTPDHYTASVGTNFIKACMVQSKSGVSNPRKTCTCTYNEIKKSIKFSRFKQINSALAEKPRPLPPDITNILDGCNSGGETTGATSSTTSTTSG